MAQHYKLPVQPIGFPSSGFRGLKFLAVNHVTRSSADGKDTFPIDNVFNLV